MNGPDQVSALLAEVLPCAWCGTAQEASVRACKRDGCPVRPRLRVSSAPSRCTTADADAELWGYRVDDLVEVDAGVGVVRAVTPAGAAGGPRLTVRVAGFRSVDVHVYRRASIRRAP